MSEEKTPEELAAEEKAKREEAEKAAMSDEMTPEKIQEMIQQGVEDKLKPMKENLDKAYNARDEALKKLAEKEEAEKAEKLKRLEEEGKTKEIQDLKLQELQEELAKEQARNKALDQSNTELTRDNRVRSLLNGLEFRNEKAAAMAFDEITSELVRNEEGAWVHKSGATITEFIESFSKSTDHSFLFKAKSSSGGGSEDTPPGSSYKSDKSLFEMSQEDVLKAAREGKLPNQKRV